MKGKKFLALAAVLVIAFAGAAWAVGVVLPGRVIGNSNNLVTVTANDAGDYFMTNNLTGAAANGAPIIATSPTLTAVGTNRPHAEFVGTGQLTGNILNDHPFVSVLRLRFAAATGGELAVRPAPGVGAGATAISGKMIGSVGDLKAVPANTVYIPNVVGLTPTTGQRNVINEADVDGLPSASTGLVLIAGANGNNPIWTAAAHAAAPFNVVVYNNWGLGTYVEHGTLAVTHENSLGLGGIALVGDTGVEPVLTIADTTAVTFGKSQQGGQITNQPLVFTRNINRDRPADTVKGVVEVGGTGHKDQIIEFLDGAWQSVGLSLDNDLNGTRYGQGYVTFLNPPRSATATALPGGIAHSFLTTGPLSGTDPRPGWPLALVTPASPNARPYYFATLLKKGVGTLIIDSGSQEQKLHIPGVAATQNYGTATGSYPGSAHFGGTEIEDGLVYVKATTANNNTDRYKGSLGATWQDNTQSSYYANTVYVTGESFFRNTQAAAAGAVGVYYGNNPVAIHNADAGGTITTDDSANTTPPNTGGPWASELKALHNPLTLTGTGAAKVDRSQVFTFFRGTEGTEFRANEFIQAGTSLRPEIHVRLARQNSVFNGTLSGSFDLILDSMETFDGNNNPTFYNAPAPGVNHIAQARLTLGNLSNNIYGRTLVADGVLEVAGNNSIGRGIGLQVGGGTNASTELYSEGVFVGLSTDKFTLPVTVVSRPNGALVDGFNTVIAPYVGVPLFSWNGALAAYRDAVTTYQDVTIQGGAEINPRVVNARYRYNEEAYEWAPNTATYDTWSGTVQFGVSPDIYRFTGTTYNHDRILISNGTLFLGDYPQGVAGSKPFGEVRIRGGATLSLAEGVWNFFDTLDVAVENQSRIRVVVKESDIKSSKDDAIKGDALFLARNINYTLLGAGEMNSDRRIDLQLDLSKLGYELKAGDWIKVVSSPETGDDFNNLHYLNKNFDGEYEDYVKVRVEDESERDLRAWAVAEVDVDTRSILVHVISDIDRNPENPPTPVDNLTITASTQTTTLIGGTVKLVDDDGAAIESADVTVSLFHGGVDTSVDTNAIATLDPKTTDANGSVSFEFTPVDAGLISFPAGAPYTVKAVTTEYTATRDVTIPGGSPISGSSSSGCDAGFGIFALLAATGAVTLLRKKD